MIADAFVKNLFAYLDRRKEYLLTKAEIFKVIYSKDWLNVLELNNFAQQLSTLNQTDH